MKVGAMYDLHETKTNNALVYVGTIAIGIFVAYFLLVGGRLLNLLFIYVVQYWWATIIIVLVLIFLRKKLKTKN